MGKRIWIDFLNPSHPLFFGPVMDKLGADHEIQLTVRDRAETVELTRSLGMKHRVIGRDLEGPISKTLSVGMRALVLAAVVKKFDIALSFENPMSVFVGRMRRKHSILLLDNDVKYSGKGSLVQRWESRVKEGAGVVIVPDCSLHVFSSSFVKSKVRSYPGYKEDIYIGGHTFDPDLPSKLPFKDYIVIRPEAFASFYVKREGSILPEILRLFEEAGRNVVLLPRDVSDRSIKYGDNVHVPPKPLNGLDLIYHSSGVLTGSGTMAREAAVIGRPAASFFPGERLLSVDEDMVKKGMMFHSRDAGDLVRYILGSKQRTKEDHDPIKVQREFMRILLEEIGG
jgi:predicted glycosyltransferase